MWKDLHIIIKGKISEEEEDGSNPKEIKEPISLEKKKKLYKQQNRSIWQIKLNLSFFQQQLN